MFGSWGEGGGNKRQFEWNVKPYVLGNIVEKILLCPQLQSWRGILLLVTCLSKHAYLVRKMSRSVCARSLFNLNWVNRWQFICGVFVLRHWHSWVMWTPKEWLSYTYHDFVYNTLMRIDTLSVRATAVFDLITAPCAWVFQNYWENLY